MSLGYTLCSQGTQGTSYLFRVPRVHSEVSVHGKNICRQVTRVQAMVSQGTQGTFCCEGLWDTSCVVRVPRVQAMVSQGTQGTFCGIRLI